jgi:3-phenylpropionate/cinnamic acid dioxygenase small subunit
MSATAGRKVRADVAEVLVRYASGIDRRDWELFRSCFTDDCEADYGPIGMWHSADEITAWMRAVHEPAGHTMHRITNETVTASDSGVTARSYVDALVMFADNQRGTRAVGYYDDELVATDDGWKIARRHLTLVLLQLVPDGTVIDLGTTAGEPPGGTE